MKLIKIPIEFNSPFYVNVIQKIIPQVKYPITEINVGVVNQDRSQKLKQEMKDNYKIYFEYPEDNQDFVGIELFKMLEEGE